MVQAFLLRGHVIARKVPQPLLKPGCVVVKTDYSCISIGTEISSVKGSKVNLVKKAMTKPKLFLRTLKIAKNRGLNVMINTIKGATGSGFGTNIGYTAAGLVVEKNESENEYQIGQRVAVVGTMYANHAEYNCVPRNLVIPIPDSVSTWDASTAALGGIAMQGVRQLSPKPNDTVVVMGLGFIGQLTVQMLLASGCCVIGIDINNSRLDIASKSYCIQTINGNDNLLVEKVLMLTNGIGVDGVIFTASTNSSAPMSSCFKMLRRKGCFVLVGVSGMTIDREDIYRKELEFKMATSYGPGRYDTTYEEEGIDYPYEYVRFTEKRNIEAYFKMMEIGTILLSNMPMQVYNISEAGKAYDRLQQSNPPMISLLDYSNQEDENSVKTKVNLRESGKKHRTAITYALIGAGSYAKSMHLPNLSTMKDKYYLKAVMNRSAAPAAALATQYKAEYYTTSIDDILNDAEIQLLLICTRHDSHARYAIKAMRAGKDVFVEKPPALDENELNELMQVIEETGRNFTVGYNRRFSKYASEIIHRLNDRKGKLFIEYTMNAGYIPYDNWVHSIESGGRIVGEGCHIIDLFQFFVGSEIISVDTDSISFSKSYYHKSDNISATLTFGDGSVALLHYISIGGRAMPKETMHIMFDEKEIYLDNYTSLTGSGIKIKKLHSDEPDKGQKDILLALFNSINRNTKYPIPLDEIKQTSLATFEIISCL